MFILLTSKQRKEKRAVEEIMSIVFQKDPSIDIIGIQIKPGLSLLESKVSINDLKSLLTKVKRAYAIKIIPLEYRFKKIEEIFSLIQEKIYNKKVAIRCSSRFNVKGHEVEKMLGLMLNNINMKIDLSQPDFVIAIEPIMDHLYVSILELKDYLFFTNKKRI
jgi:tRNA(Ser,Leu) C12 N-acetylase TAN1